METLVGVIIGCIITYFFNNKNTEKSNTYSLEREYIDKVCSVILQHLEEKGGNDSLQKADIEEIIVFVEDVYRNNYVSVVSEDREMLETLKKSVNGDLNTLIQNYVQFKKYFFEKVLKYRNKYEKGIIKRVLSKRYVYNIFIFLLLDASLICLITSICGLLGIWSWGVQFFDYYNNVLYSKGLCFEGIYEKYVFLIIGLALLELIRKLIKKLR